MIMWAEGNNFLVPHLFLMAAYLTFGGFSGLKQILEEPKIVVVKGVWKQNMQVFHTFYGLCVDRKRVTAGIQCSGSTILSKMKLIVFLLYHPMWT